MGDAVQMFYGQAWWRASVRAVRQPGELLDDLRDAAKLAADTKLLLQPVEDPNERKRKVGERRVGRDGRLYELCELRADGRAAAAAAAGGAAAEADGGALLEEESPMDDLQLGSIAAVREWRLVPPSPHVALASEQGKEKGKKKKDEEDDEEEDGQDEKKKKGKKKKDEDDDEEDDEEDKKKMGKPLGAGSADERGAARSAVVADNDVDADGDVDGDAEGHVDAEVKAASLAAAAASEGGDEAPRTRKRRPSSRLGGRKPKAKSARRVSNAAADPAAERTDEMYLRGVPRAELPGARVVVTYSEDQQPLGEGAELPQGGKELVGCFIEVYWEGDQIWYRAQVQKYHPMKGATSKNCATRESHSIYYPEVWTATNDL